MLISDDGLLELLQNLKILLAGGRVGDRRLSKLLAHLGGRLLERGTVGLRPVLGLLPGRLGVMVGGGGGRERGSGGILSQGAFTVVVFLPMVVSVALLVVVIRHRALRCVSRHAE